MILNDAAPAPGDMYGIEALDCKGTSKAKLGGRGVPANERVKRPIETRNIAAIVGVAYHSWGEVELRDTLVRLQANEESADEATFELAMVAFSKALNAAAMVDIHAGMREARGLFKQVLRRDPERLDAALHVAVIDLVLNFTKEVPEGLDAQTNALGRLLAERHDQLGIGRVPEWLAPRVDKEVEWWKLLRIVRYIDGKLRRPSWTDTARIMCQVLAVYDAERTISIGGTLNQLFAPRIEAAFIRSEGLVAHLEDLLADSSWDSTHRHVADLLLGQITRRKEGGPPTRVEEEDGAYPRLSTALRRNDITSLIPDDMALILEAALRNREAAERVKVSSDVQVICRKISEEFADATDYRNDVRYAFDHLVQQAVSFCADRQNADLSQIGLRGAYLRSATAIENELQQDLREWLRGNMTSVKVLTEVPGIAAGRTDIYVDFGNVQFVIELKRHRGTVDDAVARKYSAQAVAYQATGPKLGLLGILELEDRSGPPPSLAECVWTDAYVPVGSALTRNLVVFRVPGMLQRPSAMK